MSYCFTCRRSFKTGRALEQHTEAVHTRYDCERCDGTFNSLGARNQHNDVARIPAPKSTSKIVKVTKGSNLKLPTTSALLIQEPTSSTDYWSSQHVEPIPKSALSPTLSPLKAFKSPIVSSPELYLEPRKLFADEYTDVIHPSMNQVGTASCDVCNGPASLACLDCAKGGKLPLCSQCSSLVHMGGSRYHRILHNTCELRRAELSCTQLTVPKTQPPGFAARSQFFFAPPTTYVSPRFGFSTFF